MENGVIDVNDVNLLNIRAKIGDRKMRTSDKVAAQFNDNDRKDPLHDQITMWAHERAGLIYYEYNLEAIEVEYYGWYEKLVHQRSIKLFSLEDLKGELVEALAKIRCTWENPVYRGSYLVGYVDLYIGNPNDCQIGIVKLKEKDSVYVSDIDFVSIHLVSLSCEIKTRIDSVGDLIRQIQSYKSGRYMYGSCGKFCVISPDDRYAKLLEDQGIHFIKYTP